MSDITLNWLVTIGIGVIIIGLVKALYSKQMSMFMTPEKCAASHAAFALLLDRVTRLETKIEIFWKTMEQTMVNVLHSPHTPEFDKLLETLSNASLNMIQAERLKVLLLDEVKTANVGNSRKIAASILLARIEQVILRLNGGL